MFYSAFGCRYLRVLNLRSKLREARLLQEEVGPETENIATAAEQGLLADHVSQD